MLTKEQEEVISQIIDKNGQTLSLAADLIRSLIQHLNYDLTEDEKDKLYRLQTDVNTLRYYHRKAISLKTDL